MFPNYQPSQYSGKVVTDQNWSLQQVSVRTDLPVTNIAIVRAGAKAGSQRQRKKESRYEGVKERNKYVC
jgi:hypothetical protein